MNYPKSLRYVDRLVGSAAFAAAEVGFLGTGILFNHFARQASNFVYYSVLLGYICYLGGLFYGTAWVDTKKSRGSHRPLWPTIVFVVASMALVLGLYVPRILAVYTSNWAEYSFGLGLLLIMAAALSGTIFAAFLGWRQWRNEKALKVDALALSPRPRRYQLFAAFLFLVASMTLLAAGLADSFWPSRAVSEIIGWLGLCLLVVSVVILLRSGCFAWSDLERTRKPVFVGWSSKDAIQSGGLTLEDDPMRDRLLDG